MSGAIQTTLVEVSIKEKFTENPAINVVVGAVVGLLASITDGDDVFAGAAWIDPSTDPPSDDIVGLALPSTSVNTTVFFLFHTLDDIIVGADVGTSGYAILTIRSEPYSLFEII